MFACEGSAFCGLGLGVLVRSEDVGLQEHWGTIGVDLEILEHPSSEAKARALFPDESQFPMVLEVVAGPLHQHPRGRHGRAFGVCAREGGPLQNGRF